MNSQGINIALSTKEGNNWIILAFLLRKIQFWELFIENIRFCKKIRASGR